MLSLIHIYRKIDAQKEADACKGSDCFGRAESAKLREDVYKRQVLKVAGEKKVPVIMDVDLGHLSPMMPLITGSHGKVRVCGNDISIQFR